MPFAYHIDRDARLGAAAFSSTVVGRDIEGAYRAMVGDPRWEPGLNWLLDLRRIEGVDVAPEDVDAVIESLTLLRSRLGPGVGVIVATDPDADLIGHLIRVRMERELGVSGRSVRRLGPALDVLGLERLPGRLAAVLGETRAGHGLRELRKGAWAGRGQPSRS